MINSILKKLKVWILIIAIIADGKQFLFKKDVPTEVPTTKPEISTEVQINKTNEIPAYTGKAFTVLNNNVPEFYQEDLKHKGGYKKFTELDSLKRCGAAFAILGPETLPKEKRQPIGMVKPSGWQLSKYDFIDQKYLYNRCHLIGFQMSGENANPKNLITGTRYLNVTGMLPFENRVTDYIKQSRKHVAYRVTPIFKGNELVARGVKMEAYSIEDQGARVNFNVFVHNVQPGVTIDYKTGKNKKSK